MKKLSEQIRKKIKIQRQQGHTHRQIAKLLHIGLGSSVNFSRGIYLTATQKEKITKDNYQKSLAKLSIEQRRVASQKGGHNTLSHFKAKYSRQQVITLLQEFYRVNRRIPTKRDFIALYRVVRRLFGTWNKAIEEAGYKTNPVLFAKKYVSNDGHRCDSLAEKIIDDWLFARNVNHERNVRYGNTKYTADFKVNNIYIEFFGLIGQLKSYDILLSKKKLLIQQLGLRLISIYPQDLFPESNLDKILSGQLQE